MSYFFATNNINFITLKLKSLLIVLRGQDLLHEQISVTFDKREVWCILMQYEMELMYTFGTISLKFIFIIISLFYQLIMMWKPGTGSHFLITANSL